MSSTKGGNVETMISKKSLWSISAAPVYGLSRHHRQLTNDHPAGEVLVPIAGTQFPMVFSIEKYMYMYIYIYKVM